MKFLRKPLSYVIQVLTVLFCNSVCANNQAEPSKFHVVTCASHHTKNLEQLLVSARYNGLNVEVLGLGQPYKGNGRKFRYYLEYLQTVPENDIILFVDAYDVLILSDQKTILETFYKMNVPLLVSAETTCFPFRSLFNQYPPSSSRFKYLNSGGIIGYAGYMKNLFHDIPSFKDHQSDQGVLTKHFLSHRNAYRLDYNAEMFISLHEVARSELTYDKEKKKVFSLISSPCPCIIHGNGIPAKAHYQEIYDALFSETNP